MTAAPATPSPPPAATAQVWVSHVAVQGFRLIDGLEIDLEPDTTYLVGENNTGKTSLLRAISVALGKSRASDDDLTRGPRGAVASKAVIDLTIRPRGGQNFGAQERGALGANVYVDPADAIETSWLRTELTPSQEGGPLLSRRAFLQPGRAGLVESPASMPASVLRLFECELLDAARDLVSDLGSRASRWGRLLYDLQIADGTLDASGQPDPLSRTALEAALTDLAANMRSASPVLTKLEDHLSNLTHVQSTVGQVTIQPFPPQLEEVMRSVDVLVSHDGGEALPLRFQGLGSRSLASIFVFAALCNVRLGADNALVPHLLTLVEEPESHLHPQAVTALRSQLDSLQGQRLVTTHSTHLVSEAKPRALRVLRRDRGSFRVHRLSEQTLAGTARFRRFVGRPFGDFFFSRIVIFGDGATERDALPVLLEAALGFPPAALGVTIVDCESLNNSQVPKLIEAANQLGLPWVIFVDNDEAGLRAINQILDPDTQAPLEASSSRVVVAGAAAMEKLLLDSGYASEIDQVAAEYGETTTTDAQRLHFLKRNKGWAAEQVARLAVGNGKPVHTCIVALADEVKSVLNDRPSGEAPSDEGS